MDTTSNKRRRIVAGNWKMHGSRSQNQALIEALLQPAVVDESVACLVFPPFVYLAEVVRALEGSPIRVGAQNCCEQLLGAYTGEVSAKMVADVGATLVILGHSERRHVYGESDELVHEKVHAALDCELDVILCVGETLEERDAGATEKVIGRQLQAGLDRVTAAEM